MSFEPPLDPFLFRAHSIFCKELQEFPVALLNVETAEVLQLPEADRTEEHGLGKVLRQVAGAVHAAGKVDAVGHPEKVTDLRTVIFIRILHYFTITVCPICSQTRLRCLAIV